MKELFAPDELEDLTQQVKGLALSSDQEEMALEILLRLSKKLRGSFSTPADTIRFFLKKWDLADSYLAKILGSRSRASEILSGKRNLTMSDLRALRDNLGIPSDLLLGDPTKARTVLGWNPRKTSFEELVEIMTKHDMELVKNSDTAGVLK